MTDDAVVLDIDPCVQLVRLPEEIRTVHEINADQPIRWGVVVVRNTHGERHFRQPLHCFRGNPGD
jgi:hypothetical protein